MTKTAHPPLPLDAQLCFSPYSTTIAINRLYKPMLDSLGVGLMLTKRFGCR